MAEGNPLVAIGDTYTVMPLSRDLSQGLVFSILSLSGAVGATVIPEVTADGNLWEAVGVAPIAGGAVVTSLTVVGSYQVVLNAFVGARLRLSALTSGGPVKGRINAADY